MTTQNKPSQQATNKPSSESTKHAWYSVPVVWLGIFLTLLVIAGLVHMAVLGHKHASDALAPKPKTKAITHILGVPISEPAPTQNEASK